MEDLNMGTAHLEALRENIFKCMACGVCRGVWERKDESMCPVWATGIGFEDSTPRGRVTVAQDLLDGLLDLSMPLAESIYRCTDCACCAATCDSMDPKTGNPIVDVPRIVVATRMDLLEDALVPPAVRDYFKAVYVNGNPYKLPQEERGHWAQGSEIPSFSGQEYLFYAGDVGSFDERGKKMALSVANILMRGGVSLGIMGSRESSDGNDARVLGEFGLFQYLAETNIRMFKEAGVRKILSLDPHSYNAFKNHYPQFGADFEVVHYTQILEELARTGRFAGAKKNIRVTYHDPCYLGRHNGLYEPPRNILKSIRGLELVEMRRFKKSSFCCGGGGGNFFTDLIGGKENTPSRVRIREALETGAQVVAVACPLCAKMLEDAIKAEDVQDRLAIKDISEIIQESIQD
jgi:Fe-S oxidoreductase